MKKISMPSEEVLKNEIEVLKVTYKELSKKYGVAAGTINNWVKFYNITPVNTSGREQKRPEGKAKDPGVMTTCTIATRTKERLESVKEKNGAASIDDAVTFLLEFYETHREGHNSPLSS